MNRYLGRAAYLVAFSLFFIPLFDVSMSVLPLRIGDPRWRFGTLGLASNALMIPMCGVLIAFAVASVLEQRRTLKTFGVLSWVACGVCLVAVAAFALDALQSQGQVRAGMRLSFVVASSTGAVKILLGALGFALFGVAGMKGARLMPARPASRAPGLLLPNDRAAKAPVVNAAPPETPASRT